MNPDFKVDKTALSIVPLSEADEVDKAYWFSKTPQERLQALELIRQIVYGYDPATARLEKVFEIVRREDLE